MCTTKWEIVCAGGCDHCDVKICNQANSVFSIVGFSLYINY